MTYSEDELSAQADALYRAVDFMAKTANADAPVQLVAAQADIVRRAAEQLIQMCNRHSASGLGPARIKVNTNLPEGIQKLHSELFADHVEGTLPDTFPEDWTEEP